MRAGRIIKALFCIFTIIVLACVCIVVYSFHDQNVLTYEHYNVYSDKLESDQSFRAVVLCDLHNKEFGNENAELIEAVSAMEPDIILCAGDMVDKDSADTSVAVDLCVELNELAPLYYGLGNHEGSMIYADKIPLDKELAANGIKCLINDGETIDINGIPVDVGSIATDEEGYDIYAAEFDRLYQEYEHDTHFKLMIVHLPYLFYDKIADADYDLAVSGHFHGGHIRLPGLGGVYSELNHKIQLFPKYCSGQFELPGGYSLIVSRGLGNHEFIPRINNRPEISVIDIKGSIN